MLIETALMTDLLAQTAITALVSTRTHFGVAPQEVAKPYMVLNKISGVRIHSHETTSHLAHPRFQFSIFGTTYSSVKAVAAALQTALQGYTGTMGGVGGVVVQSCIYEDETDLDPGDQGLFGVACDYIIWHYE
jgi:hypothetical protein